MANQILRKSVYRIISDLVRSDGAISKDELDLMESIEESYGITLEDKHGGYTMTLADAAEHVAGQKEQPYLLHSTSVRICEDRKFRRRNIAQRLRNLQDLHKDI